MGRDKSVAASRENDQLLVTLREAGRPEDAPAIFLCECRDPDCVEVLKLTVAEFAKRRRERSPVLCDGHQLERAS